MKDDIVKTLSQSGIKISTGSCSNIIKNHEQLLQSNATIIEQSSSLPPQREAVITNSSHIKNNLSKSSVIVPRHGAPLLRFLKEDTTGNPDSTNLDVKSTKPEFVDFEKKPYPEFYPVEPDVNINQEEVEPKPPIKLGIDLDSDELFERGVINYIKSDKQERQKQIQQIENQQRELQEKEQQIAQWDNNLRWRESNLKIREAKVADIESLAPSVRQLRQMHVTFDMMMSYILLVNERSVLGNVSTRSAALSLSHDFKEYRSLGNILKAKQKAEQRLSELDMLITQRQAALNGITERLTQLTGFSHNNNNNNGQGDLSMTDYIRLNMLKSRLSTTTTRMAI